MTGARAPSRHGQFVASRCTLAVRPGYAFHPPGCIRSAASTSLLKLPPGGSPSRETRLRDAESLLRAGDAPCSPCPRDVGHGHRLACTVSQCHGDTTMDLAGRGCTPTWEVRLGCNYHFPLLDPRWSELAPQRLGTFSSAFFFYIVQCFIRENIHNTVK